MRAPAVSYTTEPQHSVWTRLASLQPRVTNLSRAARFALAAAIVATALAFAAATATLSFRSLGRAIDGRAASEASSINSQSARIATGEAYDAYLQIAELAGDLMKAEQQSPGAARAVLEALLADPASAFDAGAVTDLDERVIFATDGEMARIEDSEAIAATRWYLGPANSDVFISTGGDAYVDFATPLRTPDGAMVGFLVARASPERLWRESLAFSIDGSRNVIINRSGQFAAGAPKASLGQPWRGVLLRDGVVQARIDGVDSLCSVSPVGRDTRIDHGWSVASCLPADIGESASDALATPSSIGLMGLAALVLVASGVALHVLTAGPAQEPALEADPDPTEEGEDDEAPAQAPPDSDDSDTESLIDTRAIEALRVAEFRNARLAERLREAVSARLLIAATEADEAFQLRSIAPERAEAVHARAMHHLERLREQELRAIALELHPSVVRLGLPAALRSLAQTLAGGIGVRVDVDARIDAVSNENGRVPLDDGLRLLLYRFALDATQALARAGASTCVIKASRDAESISLALAAEQLTGAVEPALEDVTAPIALYGGTCGVEPHENGVMIVARVPLENPEIPAGPAALEETEVTPQQDAVPDSAR